MVNRSALLLKMLCSQQYGSLVAAPTFGLPERISGERNWDYRYTWLRDSAFSLYAFMRLGFIEEARAFTDWLRDRLHDDAEHGPLQVMYRMDGSQDLDEVILDHLRHKPSHSAACARDQVHDLIAPSLIVERALNSLDLAPDAAHARQQLLLLTNGVCHGKKYNITPHPIPAHNRYMTMPFSRLRSLNLKLGLDYFKRL